MRGKIRELRKVKIVLVLIFVSISIKAYAFGDIAVGNVASIEIVNDSPYVVRVYEMILLHSGRCEVMALELSSLLPFKDTKKELVEWILKNIFIIRDFAKVDKGVYILNRESSLIDVLTKKRFEELIDIIKERIINYYKEKVTVLSSPVVVRIYVSELLEGVK